MSDEHKLLQEAIRLIAEWCVQIEDVGSGWDDWDSWYKQANYRPGPLRELIDREKAKVRKERDE